jgi:hypothetical protein
MIRKSMPSGSVPMGGSRFSLATNAVGAEIMLKQGDGIMIRFYLIGS